MTDRFEETIRKLTEPINGQLPRPWMTEMKNPLNSDVFIVGRNQSKGYLAKDILHQRHLDALFNRNGESCQGLYNETTKDQPSPTRRNIDRFVARLTELSIHNVLETNVICYSTPMSADLSIQAHVGGARKGEEIFRYLLAEIVPKVLIVHGAGSLKCISAILKTSPLKVPLCTDEICDVQTEQHLVIPIPSLAPPQFNKWSSWSDGYLDKVAIRVRDELAASIVV